MNPKIANTQLVEKFDADGFAAVPGFLQGEALQELMQHVDQFIRDVVPTMPLEHVFYEDKTRPETLKQLQNLSGNDAWFETLFTTGPFRELAELCLKGPVVPKNLQYFNKPPSIGKPTPPHQDGYYFMLTPCEAMTMWLALEEVNEENGCVRYVAGSHKRGLRPHSRTQTLGFSQGIEDYPTPEDQTHEIAVPAQPGDLLVHHAMTIHRANGNASPTRSRKALGFVYFSERAKVDEEAKAAYQKKLNEDMKAQNLI